MKKIVLGMVTCLVMVMLFGLSVKIVGADSFEKLKFHSTMTLAYNNYPYAMDASDFGKKIKGAKKIKITSSKKKVVSCAYVPGNNPYLAHPGSYSDGFFEICPMKKGVARIKITFKKHGKKYVYRSRIRSEKYKNPLKRFKIRKKNIAKKFKKGTFYQSKFKVKKKDKINLKARKGWKIKKILKVTYKPGKKTKVKKIKNKSKIKFSKKADYDIEVTLYNKKKHQYVTITMRYKQKYF